MNTDETRMREDGPQSNSMFTGRIITLDLQTFHQSCEGGNVTGVVYVELESGAFPDRGWSDFPVIILGWWVEALLQLEMPKRREVKWLFMDGPHSLTLTKVEESFASGAVEFAQVQSSLREAAERVVSHCDRQKMFSKDLETLRMSLGRLKTLRFPPQSKIRFIRVHRWLNSFNS